METIEGLSQYSYSGDGTLSLIGNRNGVKFTSPVKSFEFTGQDDSVIRCACPVDFKAFLYSGLPIWDDHNFDQSFRLEFSGECADGINVSVKDDSATLNGEYGQNEDGEYWTLEFFTRHAEIRYTEAMPEARLRSWRYILANCPFFVPTGDKTIRGNNEHAVPRISINVPRLIDIDLRCFVFNLRNGSIGRTSTVTITPHVPTALEPIGRIADSICQLLSLAMRNTVDWIAREEVASGGVVKRVLLRNANLLPFTRGSILIPYEQLERFLELCLPYYLKHGRDRELDRAIRFLVEAEHHPVVDIKYALAFMAFERFRTKWLPHDVRRGTEISSSFVKLVAGALGQEVIQLIEKKLGKQLDPNQRGKIIKGLRDANSPEPTINQNLEALCEYFHVEGHSTKMGRLRSDLYHRGSIGDLTFEEVGQLYIDLSGIMAQCILKALHYSGQYVRQDRSRIERRPLPHGDYREMVE